MDRNPRAGVCDSGRAQPVHLGVHCLAYTVQRFAAYSELVTEAMMRQRAFRIAMGTLFCWCFCSLTLLAQSGSPPSSPPATQRPEPCWKQAGISHPVQEQRHGIESEVRSQIASVCEDSALTPQQKREQARKLRQEAEQKMDALITPEQQSALHACQQQRAGGRGQYGGRHGEGGSPCGNFRGPQGPQGSSGGNPQQPEPPQQ